MSGSEPWYKPKLIEVSIPLEDINRESAREKSIRHGHPSTLHLWWARRPLAACRAVLFAQLVDDPSAHPGQFPTDEAQKDERDRLHAIMKRLVPWDNIHDEALLKEAREEIWKSCNGSPPAILDPFAGGGSIPLEAQRLGLEAHASDLNPVAVLIEKALIEIPPKFAGRAPVFPGASGSRLSWPGATGLAEDVRRYGKWMGEEAEKQVGQLYPKAKLADGTEAIVIAWIWARTVTCPNPACRGTAPLVRSFWLSKRNGNERWLDPVPEGNGIRFEIRGPGGAPHDGTVSRSGAICLICGTPVQLDYIRAEGQAGRMGTQLMATVAAVARQRYYLPPDDMQVNSAVLPRPSEVPDGELSTHPQYMGTPRYGLRELADLFTNRQLTMLVTFNDLVHGVHERLSADGADSPYADAVATYLALCASKAAAFHTSQARWRPNESKTAPAFGRQAIPMIWDFAEPNPFANAGGDWLGIVDGSSKAIESLPAGAPGQVKQQDAVHGLVYDGLLATDPPYYDNVPYADLADYFYPWLRRSIGQIYPHLFSTLLTPKADELVADHQRHGGAEAAERFFRDGFEKVFAGALESAKDAYPITVFYAFKQAESDDYGDFASTGWDTLLEGMIKVGWTITATWPMRTEGPGRMRNIGANALASSILLACRPRNLNAAATDRRGLIAALRKELPQALLRLQEGGVAPVDLPQAAIGPGMAVFSRYSRVNEPEGSAMRVRPALAIINQVLDEVLSQQEGDFNADTRWCLDWFKSHGFKDGPYGEAETLSTAKNTSVAGLVRAGIVTAGAGKVRLLSATDLPAVYDPRSDERVSEWEIALHLARRLVDGGADAAAQFMALAGEVVDLHAVRELSYLLFSIAEKRGWADIALLFNGLGTSWSDLTEMARRQPPTGAGVQGQLGFGEE